MRRVAAVVLVMVLTLAVVVPPVEACGECVALGLASFVVFTSLVSVLAAPRVVYATPAYYAPAYYPPYGYPQGTVRRVPTPSPPTQRRTTPRTARCTRMRPRPRRSPGPDHAWCSTRTADTSCGATA